MKFYKGVLALALLALNVPKLYAEPYLAAWKGVNCNACHINQTGGYLRNDFGRNYGNSLETFDWKGISEAAETITHKTPSWVSIGLDLHESYGGLIYPGTGTSSKAFNIGTPFTSNGRQSFSVAIKANPAITGVFTYRLDTNSPKEMYAMVNINGGDAYLKFGKFVAPYGLGLANDNSLVRTGLDQASGTFSFDQTLTDGLEFGAYPGDFFLNAAILNGDQFNHPNEVNLSAKGGFDFHEAALGGSLYTEALDYSDTKMRYGVYGWTRLGPVVILGEFDSGYDNISLTPLSPVLSRTDYRAYHGSLEVDLGNSMYLRFVSEFLEDSPLSGLYDGFQHVVSFRCYPVQNFKCQLDVERLDPTTGSAGYGSGAYYGILADTYLFY